MIPTRRCAAPRPRWRAASRSAGPADRHGWLRAASESYALRRQVGDNAGVPAGALITNDADLVDGVWPFVGHRPARYDGVDLAALADREKGRSSGPVALAPPAADLC